MDILLDLVKNSTLLWTSEKMKETIDILENWQTNLKRPRLHYHLHETYNIIELAGVKKIVLKSYSKMIATKENVISIVREVHQAISKY